MPKFISDAVHGTIQLSDVETAVIDTAVFQRLRNVRQLGFSHLVFPGADHGRFSHSLGVCHITGRLLDAVGKRSRLTQRDRQKYRLAALLHDIGHLPFSHPFQDALNEHYYRRLVPSKKAGGHAPKSPRDVIKHEEIGKHIISDDRQLRKVLDKYGFDPIEIANIFNGVDPEGLSNLVASDLDADRIDYLLRNSHHGGLPYGDVDLDYLISQVQLDADRRICFDAKAARAVDHLLIARYFDYQQTVFNKAVVGFELLLKRVIVRLLETGVLKCDLNHIHIRIKHGKWQDFDDSKLTEMVKGIAETRSFFGEAARALLQRRPLATVGEIVYLAELTHNAEFEARIERLQNNLLKTWVKKYKINKNRWFIWHRRLTPTNLKRYTGDDSDPQVARVLVNRASRRSAPIYDLPSSLFSRLIRYGYYGARVYLLFEESTPWSRRDKIRREVSAELQDHFPTPAPG